MHERQHRIRREQANDEHDPLGLLTYANPRFDEYRRLASRSRSIPSDVEYSVVLTKWLEKMANPKIQEQREFFRQHLAGQTLIDLGGGYRFALQEFAEECKAARYVVVDVFGDARSFTTKTGMQVASYRMDMLEFVARLQPGSVNVVSNGIDSSIIRSAAYHRALAEEVERVLPSGGLVFGYGSDLGYDIADHPTLQNPAIPLRGLLSTMYLREKK